MKALMAICLILLTSCSSFSEHRDWAFMEKVGGLIVAGQDKNPNWLILRGDISGLKSFSADTSQLNSALAIESIESEIIKSTIQVYVVTTAISNRNSKTEISGVDISGTKPGAYEVVYLNPDGSTVHLKDIVVY